jgi:hypothetical protein
MKPTLFLRIASVLAMVHSALHTVGGVFGKPAPGVAAATFAAMQSNRFPTMGVSRSYADFFTGFGLAISIFLAIEAVVFWQLGSLAKVDAVRLRPILATFTIAYLALSVNSWKFFFAGPVVTEVLIAACLVLAILTAKPLRIA